MQEEELIKKAQKGDVRAFEQLIYQYDRHVLAIAYSYRNNDEDAKDIYQEVFLRVFKGIKSFEGKSEFSTWLFRIAANVCLTYSVRKKRHAHASLDQLFPADEEGSGQPLSEVIADESSADQQLMDEEISLHVRQAMESLSPQQRMVFTLKHLQDMKIREIAGIMKCGEGTIKKYLFTAMNKMREALKDFKESK
ncbi:MAG: RNA polymerase sigma factor [Syntrophothermus sp.]